MCHVGASGGLTWNSFGNTLFTANGGTPGDGSSVAAEDPSFVFWDAAVCGADSDGDGSSNGEELGDPACVWVKGATPASTSGISLPGDADSVPGGANPSDPSEVVFDNGGEIPRQGCSASGATPLTALALLALARATLRRRRRSA